MGNCAGAASRKLTVVGTFIFVLLLLPASASATLFSGSGTDPSGDGPSPGQDMVQASATYDNSSGSIDFRVQLAAPPADSVQVTAAFGNRSPSGTCSVPLLVIGTLFSSGVSRWLIEEDGTEPVEAEGDADRSVSGNQVRMTATDSQLKGFTPDCAEALLSDPADSTVMHDGMDAFAIRPPPPRPRLRASAGPAGKVKRGASRVVRVRVTNTGKAAATKVTVKARVKGTASLKPRVRKLGRIPAGKSRTARFTVKVNRRGKGRIKVSANVTGRQVKTQAATSFTVRVPKPPPKPSPKGGLSGKIFWAFESNRWDRSPDLVGLHFTNGRFVRWGIPQRSLPGCRKVTAKVKKGEMQPGCLRYSYNRRNGKVRIGNVTGSYRNGKLRLKMKQEVWSTTGKTWFPGLPARPGSRFRTTLINRGYYGLCGISPFCRTWMEHLTLTRNGRFGREDSSLSTGGGIGTGLPFVAVGRYSPKNRGRYTVLPGNRIRFKYASGKTVIESLIVQTNKRGRPDPVREGLIVGGTWFYKE